MADVSADIVTQKTKAQLKAERRAKQEADRERKLAKNHPAVSSKEQPIKVRKEGVSSSEFNKKSTEQTNLAKDKAVSLKPKKTGFKDVKHKLVQRPQEHVRVNLFRHLSQPDKRCDVIGEIGLGSSSPIHPAFLSLGVQLDEFRITGSNARCLTFLRACGKLIRSHNPAGYFGGDARPSKCQCRAVLHWTGTVYGLSKNVNSPGADGDVTSCIHRLPVLERHCNFLDQCRPLAVTVRTACVVLKQSLSVLDDVFDWEECRELLLAEVERFVRERLFLAGRAIDDRAASAIRPGECVATFGYSTRVRGALITAWQRAQSLRAVQTTPSRASNREPSGVQKPKVSCADVSTGPLAAEFSVLVVDAGPMFGGRRMLAELVSAGIPCEYLLIGALPGFASKISLVLLGAHGLLNNGHVLSQMGAAQVANVSARIAHAPVLVCAETSKFWDRAQSDAFEYNELVDPDDLWRHTNLPVGCKLLGANTLESQSGNPMSAWRDSGTLHLLNLAYDVLPPSLVTAVVTEIGILPTTSVPVVLRVKQSAAASASPVAPACDLTDSIAAGI